jgi:hypothetical protein
MRLQSRASASGSPARGKIEIGRDAANGTPARAIDRSTMPSILDIANGMAPGVARGVVGMVKRGLVRKGSD